MARKPVTDHLGNQFESKSAMYAYYDKPHNTVENRLRRGWTLEQALTIDNSSNAAKVNFGKTCKDHLGNEYNSIRIMCEKYGITEKIYWGRIRTGWSVEKALTTPIVTQPKNSKEITDHEGHVFPSKQKMCKYWDIPSNTYNLRIKNGWSMEKALTEPIHKVNNMGPKPCKDHIGNEFPSQNAMCRHYGITKDLLRSRLDLGWTLEEILTNPEIISPNQTVTDPFGNTYESIKDMCSAYEISYSTYSGRRKQGYSMADALTKQDNNIYHKCRDHLGNNFNSILEMCKYWNIDYKTYYARLANHNLRYTLATIAPMTRIDEHLLVQGLLEEPFYKIVFDEQLTIWFDYEIMNYYRKINNIRLDERIN